MFNGLLNKLYKRLNRDRNKMGIATSVVGLLSNLVLFVIKFIAGLISGSVSIMADAMNNFTDGASSLINLFAFNLAAKPPDPEHPYGHERSEYISSLIVSIIIILVGYQFLSSSIQRILNPTPLDTSILISILLLVSIFLKWIQGVFYKNTAEFLNSKTILVTAQDSFNDVYTTIVVLLSTIIEHFTGWHLDGYMGLIVALYILYSGIQLIREAMTELLGTPPSTDTLKSLISILETYPNIIGYHDLLIHDYGPNKFFASIHIEIDDTWSLPRAHRVINQIEKDVQERLNIHLVCHIDPIAMRSERDSRLYREVKRIVKSFNIELKFHDFQVESHPSGTMLHFDVVVPNDAEINSDELILAITNKIEQQMGNYQTNITVDYHDLLDMVEH